VAASFNNLKVAFLRKRFPQRGQTLVEYALIIAFLSIVAIGVLFNLGKQITGFYSSVNSKLSTAVSTH
jgi:Flp pilus assembly pilin Flp